MEVELVKHIEEGLRNHMYGNSIFLAERLFAMKPSLVNLHLLANSYFSSGNIEKTTLFLKLNIDKWMIVDNTMSSIQKSIIYLFATVLIKADKFLEAETQLLTIFKYEPLDANVNYWLGVVFRYTGRTEKALEHFRKAIELNALLWSAFENVCELGGQIEPTFVFHPDRINLYTKQSPSTSLLTPKVSVMMETTPAKKENVMTPGMFTPGVIMTTPGNPLFSETTPVSFQEPMTMHAPLKKKAQQAKPKKGSKLFENNDIEYEVESINHDERQQTVIKTPVQMPNLSDPQNFLFLLSYLGEAFLLYSQFRCRDAISAFEKIPQTQFETGWVMSIIGKAHFEMNDYHNAEKVFEKLIHTEPFRIEGLEYYSTLLWHQKKWKKLGWLTQYMSEINSGTPYTQICLGNFYSSQKDHKTALKHFQGATNMNPYLAYAYTLAGHEHYANDDNEEALASFRKAIRVNDRHYNAWYGLGKVYYRQQRYDLAIYHFEKALTINPRSPVLYCYLAMTLDSSGQYVKALHKIQEALFLDPNNPMAKYKKAKILISLHQYQSALTELEGLTEIEPKESSIYSLLGEVYKRLDQKQKALYNYNLALDLENPQKDNQTIKIAMLKLFEENTEQ